LFAVPELRVLGVLLLLLVFLLAFVLIGLLYNVYNFFIFNVPLINHFNGMPLNYNFQFGSHMDPRRLSDSSPDPVRSPRLGLLCMLVPLKVRHFLESRFFGYYDGLGLEQCLTAGRPLARRGR
jgi:hypothetical protein